MNREEIFVPKAGEDMFQWMQRIKAEADLDQLLHLDEFSPVKDDEKTLGVLEGDLLRLFGTFLYLKKFQADLESTPHGHWRTSSSLQDMYDDHAKAQKGLQLILFASFARRFNADPDNDPEENLIVRRDGTKLVLARKKWGKER